MAAPVKHEDPVQAAFERSQIAPAWPAVGTPNVQAATPDGVQAVDRTHSKQVRMVGRFEWAVGVDDQRYGSEGEALAAANRG